MDITGLTSVAGRYYALRGLLLLPTGLLLVAGGFFNMPPIGSEPVSGSAEYFFGALAIAAIGYFVVNHYYVTRFGCVDPSTRAKVLVGVLTVLSALGIGIGITLDSQFDLPFTVFGTTFAIAWLGYYQMIVGLKPYHWVFLGGCGLLSLAPIWGGVDDKVSLVMIPMGLATIGVGLLDHWELVKSIRQVRSAGIAR